MKMIANMTGRPSTDRGPASGLRAVAGGPLGLPAVAIGFLILLGGARMAPAAATTDDDGRNANANADATDAPAPAGAKDPLAYRVLELPGGTAVRFDNWQYGPILAAPNAVYCDAAPKGRAKDFFLRTVVGTPDARDMANLFTVGPQLTRLALAQVFGPVFKPKGKPRKCTCGGDEAMVEQYEGKVQGTAYTCRVLYVKRKDVAVAVLAVGTEAGFREFGRAIEIVAQGITFTESAVEPGLIGTWTKENFITVKVDDPNPDRLNLAQARSITFYPNGTFSDTSRSGLGGRDFTAMAEGGDRGTVVKRGNVLTFHYDNGTTWSPTYELSGSGLKLDGKVYLR